MHAPAATAVVERSSEHLHLVICGAAGDGKSTLAGRLLTDSRLGVADQGTGLDEEPQRPDAVGGGFDPFLAFDAACGFFAAARRSFTVVDVPGDMNDTRAITAAASPAAVALIVVDVRNGITAQTRRHSFMCALLGIRHAVLAVSKMDLADFREESFDRVRAAYAAVAAQLGFGETPAIPVAARHGDNVVNRSSRTSWYRGPTLLEHLQAIRIDGADPAERPLRFLVQGLDPPNGGVPGYAGTLVSGTLAPGDPIVVAASGQPALVKEVRTPAARQARAGSGHALTITLSDAIDAASGDMLVSPQSRPDVSDQFAAHVIWMADEPLMPGRSYLCRIGAATTPLTVTTIKYRIDVTTNEHLAARTLGRDDVGFCNLATGAAVAFDPYAENRRTGSFVIIDRASNRIAGAGMISFALRRGANIHWQPLLIGKAERAALKQQRPAIVWFTGLSGAGKSTVANLVEQRLHAAGYHTMLLDGDNVRHGLNRDLGFTEADRVENIRRAGAVAKLMTEGGLIVLCSFISPYRSERDMVRASMERAEFVEVFVDTPIEECIRRDPKGLYAKAKAGKLSNFTGFDAPYEPPLAPDVHLQTLDGPPDRLAEAVVRALAQRGIIRSL